MNKKTIYKKSAKFFENEAEKILSKLSNCTDVNIFNLYLSQLEAIKARINLELKLIDQFSDDEEGS